MSKQTQQCEIGMVGLGVMGRNFALNMADHGFSVAGYDKDTAKIKALGEEAEKRDIRGATDIEEFISLLRLPRAVMMLVPAGPPVDSVIKDLLPHLEKGDLIIDAGNSYFKDTDVRARDLAKEGSTFSGWACRAVKKGRVAARASCQEDQRKPTSGFVPSLKPLRRRSKAIPV